MKREMTTLKPTNGRSNLTTLYYIAVIFAMMIFSAGASGCKKDASNLDRDYGYAKVTVACKSKCHISFPVDGSNNEYDAEDTTSVYYIRYRRNFSLNINVTPINQDQQVTLKVFSREERQIFSNTSTRKANEIWNSVILIP
jgi:hypothetical protein